MKEVEESTWIMKDKKKIPNNLVNDKIQILLPFRPLREWVMEGSPLFVPQDNPGYDQKSNSHSNNGNRLTNNR